MYLLNIVFYVISTVINKDEYNCSLYSKYLKYEESSGWKQEHNNMNKAEKKVFPDTAIHVVNLRFPL